MRAEKKSVGGISVERYNQEWTVLYDVEDLKYISKRFWRTGLYSVRVNVRANSSDKETKIDHQPDPVVFRLEDNQVRHFLSSITLWDYCILLLAVVFASILAFVAIDKLDTFGSISDYALAFLGGFGLNATTSGFSAVVSRFKAASPS